MTLNFFISEILCSYCSPSNANFRRCSSLSFFITVFCSSLVVVVEVALHVSSVNHDEHEHNNHVGAPFSTKFSYFKFQIVFLTSNKSVLFLSFHLLKVWIHPIITHVSIALYCFYNLFFVECQMPCDQLLWSFVLILVISFIFGVLLVELLCDEALTPIDCIECSEVILLLLLLSPPVCSSALSGINYRKIIYYLLFRFSMRNNKFIKDEHLPSLSPTLLSLRLSKSRTAALVLCIRSIKT
ncbi:hypothetical protein AGLY_007561 [Aphis glycines]|uniref:Uncharacterized protein n=1 Tax=Aphis glycines TaxID=307491 RepID=A0A6G0TPM4_APHGL|nr:hypothetical protein AGLY_007561 [Aphis glycines]